MALTPAATCLCPGCERETHVDRIADKGITRLLACRTCGLVFADRKTWTDPYEKRDYYSDTTEENQHTATCTKTHEDRLRFIRRWIQEGRLLEFGGGRGGTALAASSTGFLVTLIEDSANAVQWGNRHCPQIQWIHSADVPRELASSEFDLVTAFHVLEHVLEPRALLRQFNRALKPGGILCLEVPNWDSHARRLRGLNWVFVLDHHVNQFNKQSLCRMAAAEGFQFLGCEYRRTFAINENHPWKEPLKRILCWAGFGNVLRGMWRKASSI